MRVFSGGGGKNRTLKNGFGDRYNPAIYAGLTAFDNILTTFQEIFLLSDFITSFSTLP